MKNNDYIRQKDGHGTKAAQRLNVQAPERSHPNGGAQMSYWDMKSSTILLLKLTYLLTYLQCTHQ